MILRKCTEGSGSRPRDRRRAVDLAENIIEFRFRDQKGVVLWADRAGILHVVQSHAIGGLHDQKVVERFGLGRPRYLGHELRRGAAVGGVDDGVLNSTLMGSSSRGGRSQSNDAASQGRGSRRITEAWKLASMLVADIVGYSRLAGAEKDRTLPRQGGPRRPLTFVAPCAAADGFTPAEPHGRFRSPPFFVSAADGRVQWRL
jgi:hypothetical protein